MADNLKILIVEDNAPIRRSLVSHLKHAGFTVAAYENSDKAKNSFESFEPQIILMDIRLNDYGSDSDMNGIQLMAELSRRKPNHFARIFYSAYEKIHRKDVKPQDYDAWIPKDTKDELIPDYVRDGYETFLKNQLLAKPVEDKPQIMIPVRKNDSYVLNGKNQSDVYTTEINAFEIVLLEKEENTIHIFTENGTQYYVTENLDPYLEFLEKRGFNEMVRLRATTALNKQFIQLCEIRRTFTIAMVYLDCPILEKGKKGSKRKSINVTKKYADNYKLLKELKQDVI